MVYGWIGKASAFASSHTTAPPSLRACARCASSLAAPLAGSLRCGSRGALSRPCVLSVGAVVWLASSALAFPIVNYIWQFTYIQRGANVYTFVLVFTKVTALVFTFVTAWGLCQSRALP